MFSRTIFRQEFKVALEEALDRKQMSLKELAELSGLPAATLYKITSGERDPRFSTVKAIVHAFEPYDPDMIAIIAAKFLLDAIDTQTIGIDGKKFRVKGYTAHTMEDCIVAAVKAEKEGAAGIICAPILATLIERIVDIPVVLLKPDISSYEEAIKTLTRQLE
ncbi:MAG: transcriptional regulator [Methanomicrobiales archaeon HGW-Methanomicrobiales-4]|nr:MAG: transcriptional regulator [Methanomicrobiales archaeon HGW-Methanomicrobiales-4]